MERYNNNDNQIAERASGNRNFVDNLGRLVSKIQKLQKNFWRGFATVALALAACSTPQPREVNVNGQSNQPYPTSTAAAALPAVVRINDELREQLRNLGLDDSVLEQVAQKYIANYGCPTGADVAFEAGDLRKGVAAVTDYRYDSKVIIDLGEILALLEENGIPVNPENLKAVIERIGAHEMGHVCFHYARYYVVGLDSKTILEIKEAGGREIIIDLGEGKKGSVYSYGLDFIVVDGNEIKISLILHESVVEYLSHRLYRENPKVSEVYPQLSEGYARLAQFFEELEKEGRFDIQKLIEYYSKDRINLSYYIIADALGIRMEDLTGEHINYFMQVLINVGLGRIDSKAGLEMLKNYR